MPACWLDGTYGIEIELPHECIADLTAIGRDCEPEARYWASQPDVAAQLDEIGHDVLVRSLRGYGAWSDEELADREWTRLRAIWIAAGNRVSTDEED